MAILKLFEQGGEEKAVRKLYCYNTEKHYNEKKVLDKDFYADNPEMNGVWCSFDFKNFVNFIKTRIKNKAYDPEAKVYIAYAIEGKAQKNHLPPVYIKKVAQSIPIANFIKNKFKI
jgi:hypothetical protein